VATGKRPEQHGILGREEPAENGVDARPFSSMSRRCKAIWNILTDLGLNCHVIGWPATWPAERLNGVMLSSGWDAPRADKTSSQTDPSEAVWPADFIDTMAELRMHASELKLNDLRSFIPSIQPTDPINYPAIVKLAGAVASAASEHAAATYLMENEPWDFLAVHFSSLGEITRSFIQFHPPRLSHLNEERFEKFRHVVAEAYRFHDKMLGRLIELAGPATTVVLCSASGVHIGKARAVVDPAITVSYPDHYHLKGLCFMSNPAIQRDELIYGATIYDIAPTILALLGAAIPRDMSGRVLAEAFSQPISLTFVDTWESNPAAERARQPPRPLGDGSPSPAMQAMRRNEFNLARSLQASGRHDLALPLLEATRTERPLLVGPTLHLIHCYRALGRTADAVATLERIAAQIELDQANSPPSVLPNFDLMRGLLALDRGDGEIALSHLHKAETAMPQLPAMHIHLGQVYSHLRRHRNAELAFRRALEIDPEQTEAAAGLSAALYRQGRYEEAVDYALMATAHAPWIGENHLQLGRCLARLHRDQDALLAVRNALRRQPALIEAHRLAVVLHRRTLGEVATIQWHQAAIARLLPLRSQVWKLLKKD
jgi:tetratricopeptide (TPR) repeat protein